MKVVDDAIFQYECGRLLGANSTQVYFPESIHPFAIKELQDKHHAKFEYIGIDNNSVYKEPMFVYMMTLPDDYDNSFVEEDA